MAAQSSGTLKTLLVSTDWLAEHLKDADLRILDCTVAMVPTANGRYAFASGHDVYNESHIPGATFCDVTNDLKDKADPRPQMMPSAAQMSEVMGALGVSNSNKVIVYDRGNHAWAARVWWTLRCFGFENAAVLDGGWQKWTAEGRAVSSEPASYPRAKFEAHYRPELIVGKQDVLAAIGKPDITLINALSPGEHSGEVKRLPRAGRIKGSVNVHADSLLDPANKSYRSPTELKVRFDAVGANKAKRVIAYCGGGVSACSDALALALLGYDNVAVYDGSLAEWTADPNAPMETG
ncbi:MAG: sulfurtransferase [Alphaproteobacteria bacterium]